MRWNQLPREIKEKMLERQAEQNEGFVDATVFIKDIEADKEEGGFNWCITPEENYFWHQVLHFVDFEHFYEKYPKKESVVVATETMKEEMTITEALEAGYTLCGRGDRRWECLTNIQDLDASDFLEDDYYLAYKEGTVHTFNRKGLSELLADVISSDEADNSGRDDDAVYDAISAIDFSYVHEQIQDVLNRFLTYELTDIKLIN